MKAAHNVDDVLVKSMHEQNNNAENSNINEKIDEQPKQEKAQESPPVKETTEQKSIDTNENSNKPAETTIDEYGNPIEKPRMYTEEEVQQKIRERLSRGHYAKQQTQQQTQQIQKEAENFQPDTNSEETWEVQLERFIENTIEKRQNRHYEENWRKQETLRQAEFEEKFSNGMNKYKDFNQVVAGKPITNTMMLATRNLDNPAAFVYGASKLHPAELDRISKISDPYVQAAEVGRLHEKMIKERKVISSAGKPLETAKGDMPMKDSGKIPIDVRIMQHAKQKLSKRG
jgi:hypothetical protein